MMPVDAVVLDTEGTTTSVAFATDVLYPYARERLPNDIRQHRNEPEVATIMDDPQKVIASKPLGLVPEWSPNPGFRASHRAAPRVAACDRRSPAPASRYPCRCRSAAPRLLTGRPGALERAAPTLPMRPGRAERREFEDIRHGTLTLIASFDVATGQWTYQVKPLAA